MQNIRWADRVAAAIAVALSVAATPVLAAEQAIRIPHTSEAAVPNLAAPEFVHDPSRGVVTDFRQREPHDGARVSARTMATLAYDERGLQVTFICEADKRSLRAHIARREEIANDDHVVVYLDTFRDGHRAYVFAANPLGVQLDGVITEGQKEDDSFDTVWKSDGELTAYGYVVRLTIPFRSIRFANGDPQTWRVAVGRAIPGASETSYWPAISKRVQGFVPQFADAHGLRGLASGANVQLTPYAMLAGARVLDESGSGAALANTADARAGIDAKFIVRNAVAIDATFNPDFSQVESDEPQVTINRRYEVFFPERRPFFVENAATFVTPINLFFSRRLADPQGGVRATGKAGRWAFGGVLSDDRAPGQRLAATDAAFGTRTAAGAAIVRREFAQDSSVGMMVTTRQFGAAASDVQSVDGRVRLTPTWTLSLQFAHAATTESSGKQRADVGYFAEARRDGKFLDQYLRYVDLGPDFRAPLGFVKRVDMRQIEHQIEYRWRPRRGPVVKFGPSLTTTGTWGHDGVKQDGEVNASFKVDFRRQTKIEGAWTRASEAFEGDTFRKHAAQISLTSEWFPGLGGAITYTRGTDINFDPAAGRRPFAGAMQEVEAALTFRPTSGLRIDQSFIHSRLALAGARVFANPIVRTKVNQQITRALSFRGILDYEAVRPNAVLSSLDNEARLTGDLLFTYLVSPGRAVYIGYTDRYDNFRIDPFSRELRRTDMPTLSTGRQLFVKVGYLFRP